MSVDRILVEDRFRKQCEEPRCPNFNTSLNCPPHAPPPARFREHLSQFTHALAFKFDVPAEAFSGGGGREVGHLLHEAVADLEHYARTLGFEHARGYSSGGCKRTLCNEHAECAALQEDGECRNPATARPSLSGMGVNWHELSQELGWAMMRTEDGESGPSAETVMMAGLVLLE
jgi:predicted metal-binding protein